LGIVRRGLVFRASVQLPPAAAVVAALCLLWSASASAETCRPRPGTAGLDQYCETVPDAKGDKGASTRSEGTRLRDRLKQSEVKTLEARGSTGRAVLSLPAGPRPQPTRSTTRSASSGSKSKTTPPRRTSSATVPQGAIASDVSSSPFSALGSALFEDTLDWVVLLLLSVLAAATVFLARHLSSRNRR
jgi:hypothetical protein